jgi:GDP-L-fucose synthase
MIRKFHEAKMAGHSTMQLWGSGTPLREFLHVDDLADAAVFLMQSYSEESHINVGSGTDLSISALAAMVADVVGYSGSIEFDASRPDGTPRKLLDVSKLRAHGWSPRVELRAGIESTYHWFLEHVVGHGKTNRLSVLEDAP